MFTTLIQREGQPREWEVKTLITMLEFKYCCLKLDHPQTNIVSLEWDESTTNLLGGGRSIFSIMGLGTCKETTPKNYYATQIKCHFLNERKFTGFIVSFKDIF
jgi:hypothetical protein